MKTLNKRTLGSQGERIAADYLKKQGYEILAKNFRAKRSEIDIVAKKGSILVFVEVKTRTSLLFGAGEESVDLRKQHQISKAALSYLQLFDLTDCQIRFDVIAIQISETETKISHFPDAFFVDSAF